ncbi:MAG: GNAT family N-acetyltransferase [Granulosicoccaceae bacterium]
MEIRRVSERDTGAMTALYNRFIRETLVSFETEEITPTEMMSRVQAKLRRHEWLVAYDSDEFLGFAYFGEFRERAAYAGTVEASIYLCDSAVGRGVATELYGALIRRAGEQGYREVIGVITVPNDRSEGLHRRLGFTPVGVLRRVGRKFGQDADVALWQMQLPVVQ